MKTWGSLWMTLFLFFGLSLGLPAQSTSSQTPKNIIIMINDGTSWGSWDAASLYEHGVRVMEHPVYKSFPVAVGVTTFPLNINPRPTRNAKTLVGYDPVQAWDMTPKAENSSGAGKFPFVGYNYLSQGFTDSAAAATAMASGIKTYNNAINMDNFGNPVPFVSQVAKAAGKKVGVVTSVSFSHATPGAFGAQNVSRNNYGEIAEQMLTEGTLDLILAGGGHPWYNESGVELSRPHFDMIAESEWEGLTASSIVPAGREKPWQLIQSKEEFEALAAGKLKTDRPLVGVAEVGWTLQKDRRRGALGDDPSLPSGVKMNPNVPTLRVITEGALRYLYDQDTAKKGIFLMIEGGAADWASHSNQIEHAIEETMDFTQSVLAVFEWVEKYSSWNETLVIITTDHGNGMPYGPLGKTTTPYQPLSGKKGEVPQVTWQVGTHSNELVYLWARGAGSTGFEAFKSPERRDPQLKTFFQLKDDRYIDNTNVYHLVSSFLKVSP